jgi:hypothetical protein
MFRLPATVAVFLGCVFSAATCPATGQVLLAEDKNTWQEAELKKLQGRWTTFREEKTHEDKIRRRRVDLEFADGELRVLVFDEKDAKIWDGRLKVISVERVTGGLGMTPRLNLDKGEVHYDFVGDKMIVVGRIGPRPWEGFPLSGEYQRAEQPKRMAIMEIGPH